MEKYDFSGWATKNNLLCSDGRTILKDAFKHNDGQTVPLVWNHQHNEPTNVLGHALLENRDEGVYAYCTFNDTESGREAKQLVEHKDVCALSIYANQLKQQGTNVLHGAIREVSLVLAGANPGAFIDSIIAHGEASEEEAIIYTGEDINVIEHACIKEKEDTKVDNETKKPEGEKTVGEVFNTLTEEQKTVVYGNTKAKSIFDKLWTENSEYRDKLKQTLISTYEKQFGLPSDMAKTTVEDQLAKDPFKTGIYSMVKQQSDSKMLVDEYKKAGYSAIVDYFDKGTMGEQPLILFNASSDVVKRGESFISEDVKKQMIKELATSSEFAKHPSRWSAEILKKHLGI